MKKEITIKSQKKTVVSFHSFIFFSVIFPFFYLVLGLYQLNLNVKSLFKSFALYRQISKV